MSMDTQLLMEKAAAHVRALFEAEPAPALVYHNLSHTRGVVKAAQRIADHYRLPAEEYATVCIAAWFHDTGYLFGPAEHHEDKSAELAGEFLAENGAGDLMAEQAKSCIRATRMPQHPANLMEQIVCDADVFHFGTEEFKEKNKLMHQEAEIRSGHSIGAEEWRNSTIRLLQEHHFQTDYCQALLKQGKEENLQRLISKSEKKAKEQAEARSITPPDTQEKNGKETGRKEDKAARGIDTMYRVTSANHLKLSSMADTKANILITVNSIILSVIVSLVVRKLDSEPHLIIPIIILLASSLTTIVFSILVTRPNVTQGISSREEISRRNSNLLFFGNFYNMDIHDYEWGMKEMRKDVDFVYDSMSRDIYYLGKVLARKYRLLHKAYNFFMFGIIISVVSLLVAQLLYLK